MEAFFQWLEPDVNLDDVNPDDVRCLKLQDESPMLQSCGYWAAYLTMLFALAQVGKIKRAAALRVLKDLESLHYCRDFIIPAAQLYLQHPDLLGGHTPKVFLPRAPSGDSEVLDMVDGRVN